MLKITTTQYDLLSQQSQINFEQRLTQWLVEKFNEQFDKNEAQILARQAIDKSQRYGLQTEKDIGYIAERMFMEGVEFEHQPQNHFVKNILINNALAGNDKIYEIYKYELELSFDQNSTD